MKEKVIEALQKVQDPELDIDVWTLELIYNIDIKEDKVKIKMTFTSPMCPFGPTLVENIKTKVKEIEGIKDVEVEVTFDPPWAPSDELRATLGV